MANGLKGFAIGYTNTSGADEILTISGACKVTLEGSAAIEVWTASQETTGTRSWEATYKQTFAADKKVEFDAASKQLNSEFFEDIMIQIPDTVKVHGWVWGQGADWDVSAAP